MKMKLEDGDVVEINGYEYKVIARIGGKPKFVKTF